MKEILFAFKANRLLNEDDLKKIENLIEKSNYSIKDKLISVFPNKAKTVVYVIKESHLIFQEYPEFNLLLGNLFLCRNEPDSVLIDFCFKLKDILNFEIISYHIVNRF